MKKHKIFLTKNPIKRLISKLTDNNKICDLHTHSVYSDGTCTPEQIIDKATLSKLSAVALCDHNTTAGLKNFISYAKGKNITAVPGVEITTKYKDYELHILGLFLDTANLDTLNSYLDSIYQEKLISYENLLKTLNDNGYNISYDNVFSDKNLGTINRVHFANELLRLGYVKSIKEAFDTILSEENGVYIPSKRKDTFEVIKLLDSISAVPVLAHPFFSIKDTSELVAFLKLAQPCGLAGIETDYSLHDKKQTKTARKIADKLNLLKSGGSDFHGDNKPDISLAVGKGNLHIPYSYYKALADFSDKKA